MPRHEGSVDDRAKVLAAARAVTSWARARRATWTSAPVPIRPVAAAVAPAHPAAAAASPADVRRATAAPAAEPRRSAWRDTVQPAIRLWAPRIAAAVLFAAAIGAAVMYGPRLWRATASSASRLVASRATAPPAPVPAPIQPASQPRVAAEPASGSLHVVSTPSGARVLLDGAPRGLTPLTLDDVTVGRHTIVVQSSAGTIQRVVAIAPGIVTEVDESIFSGWVVVYAPFEVSIGEGTRALRLDDRGEIMLPAGPHDLRLYNRALGFEDVRHVDLKPGDRATISLKPPRTSLTVTATEPADVWLDGSRLGEVPVTGAPVDLGTHELQVRRKTGGERRMTITATVQPVAINVDFSKPPA